MHVALRLLLLTCALALGSCASLKSDSSPDTSARPIPSPLRGEFMVLSPAHLQRQDTCDSLPPRERVRIDDMQVVPERIRAGEEVNQVVSYTFCEPSEAVTVPGRISRVVTFQGREVFRDATSQIDFKPGVWAIGAIIGIPKSAKSGTYTMSTAIAYQGKKVEKSKTFYVATSSGRR